MVVETEDVQIYEALGDSSDQESFLEPEKFHNEEIEATAPTMLEASHAFLNSVNLSKETTQDKVKRIRWEIDELRKSGAEIEAKSLITELYDSLNRKPLAQKNTEPSSAILTTSTTDSSEEFVNLEERISKLERVIGSSAASSTVKSPISESVKRMQGIISLLANDPETLEVKLKRISDTPKEPSVKQIDEKIAYVYSRLAKYQNTIDSLPTVIGRLRTLHEVHRNAISSAENIEHLEKSVDTLLEEIKAWRSQLTSTEANVQKYIDTSNANLEKLNTK